MADLEILKCTLSTEQVIEAGTSQYEEALDTRDLIYYYTSPLAVVKARSVDDVKLILAFANTEGLRLITKNGSHSYTGYCLNNGELILDTSMMNTCDIDYGQMVVTMEGGAVWKDVCYKYLKDMRHFAIRDEGCPINMNGFAFGTSLNASPRSYGLACDSLLEMTVVTWAGEVVTVSRDDNDEDRRDLFWALAGAGGGNFGVIVSTTSRMHKLRDENGMVVCGQLLWNLPQQKEHFEGMMERFNNHKSPEGLAINVGWEYTASKQLMGGLTVTYNGGWRDAQEALKPLLDFKPARNSLKETNWTEWVQNSQRNNIKSTAFYHHSSFIFSKGAITPELTDKISNLVREAAEVVETTYRNGPHDPKCYFTIDYINAEAGLSDVGETPFYWRKDHYVATVELKWNQPRTTADVMKYFKKCYAELMPYALEQLR